MLLNGSSYTISRKELPFYESSSRELYFVFCNTSPHLLSPFCKDGYQHVYLIERLEHIWMMYNPTRCGLSVSLPPCDSNHNLIQSMTALEDDIDVLGVLVEGSDKKLAYRPRIMNCVTICCNIAGLSTPFWCLTPWQLRKRLLQSKHPNIAHTWIEKCHQEKVKQDAQSAERKKPQQEPAKSVSN